MDAPSSCLAYTFSAVPTTHTLFDFAPPAHSHPNGARSIFHHPSSIDSSVVCVGRIVGRSKSRHSQSLRCHRPHTHGTPTLVLPLSGLMNAYLSNPAALYSPRLHALSSLHDFVILLSLPPSCRSIFSRKLQSLIDDLVKHLAASSSLFLVSVPFFTPFPEELPEVYS